MMIQADVLRLEMMVSQRPDAAICLAELKLFEQQVRSSCAAHRWRLASLRSDGSRDRQIDPAGASEKFRGGLVLHTTAGRRDHHLPVALRPMPTSFNLLYLKTEFVPLSDVVYLACLSRSLA